MCQKIKESVSKGSAEGFRKHCGELEIRREVGCENTPNTC
jgi:hypothetical protein